MITHFDKDGNIKRAFPEGLHASPFSRDGKNYAAVQGSNYFLDTVELQDGDQVAEKFVPSVASPELQADLQKLGVHEIGNTNMVDTVPAGPVSTQHIIDDPRIQKAVEQIEEAASILQHAAAESNLPPVAISPEPATVPGDPSVPAPPSSNQQ
jgi:hypothetical protein